MAIQVSCTNPQCQKMLRLRDELAGKHVRCPGCGNTVAVPAVATPVVPVAAVPVEAVPVVSPAPVPVEAVLQPVAVTAKPGGGILFALVAAAGLAGFVLVAGTAVLFLTGPGDSAETAQNNPPSPNPLSPHQPRHDDRPKDEVVDALESRVESGSVAEQIKAAQEAGALGERARPMAESLCELAARSSGPARAAALDALEKVHPALYGHVRTLLTVTDYYARKEALEKLREMGGEGRGAVPAVRFLLGDESAAAECLTTLAAIGHDDPEVVKELTARLKDPGVKEQWRRSGIVQAAATGLGEVAAAEPHFRAHVAAALIPLLDGSDKLPAVRALASCGKEAADAEAKLKALRYDPSAEVQKAADAALVEIDGHRKADALVGPVAAKPDLTALGRFAGDRDSKWVRQQARERLRLAHPDLERLALILFETPKGGEVSGLDTLRPVGKQAGAAIPPMVEAFAQSPPPFAYGSPQRPSVGDVYNTMFRLAPDSPEVRKFAMKTARAYADRVRSPATYAVPPALPEIWTGRMLIESDDSDPEVKKLLIELALQIADSEWGRETGKEVIREQGTRLGWVVGDLGELARRRPEWRAEIAGTLVKVMEKRTPEYSSDGGHVDHAVLAQALHHCEGEAYVRLKNHPDLKGYWRTRFVALIDQLEKEGKARPGGSPGAVTPVASSGEKGRVPPPAPPPGSKRPPHARPFRNKFYSTEGQNYWDNAKARAETLGARLAIIPDKETNDFLTQLVDDAGHNSAYIGARLTRGEWLWVDGSPVKFRSWSTRLRTIHDQFSPYAYLADDGTWGTSRDNRGRDGPVARPAVYEWDLEKDAKPWAAAPSPTPPSGSRRPGDTVAFRGKHYRYISEQLSWHQAKLRCEELGGRLAVVPDQEMNDFLMMLLTDVPAKSAWIGMTCEKGAWAWADGSAAGFKNFEGNPAVGGEKAYAVLQVETQGKWSVLPNRPARSSETPGFICEWDE